jgi:flagellar protein FliO/FliZ
VSGTSALGALLRVGLSLAVIAAMVWLAGRVALRRGAVRPTGVAISVLARRSLGRRASLVVVEAAGRHLLVGVTEQHLSLVAELDPASLTETEGVEAAVGERQSRATPDETPSVDLRRDTGGTVDLRSGGIVATLRELTVRRAQGSGP